MVLQEAVSDFQRALGRLGELRLQILGVFLYNRKECGPAPLPTSARKLSLNKGVLGMLLRPSVHALVALILVATLVLSCCDWGMAPAVGHGPTSPPESRVAPSREDDQVSYSRDILPLLADKCFACHGPDASTRAADLRLDQLETAVDYGAIVPHSADDSEMIARIQLPPDDPAVMPPVETQKSLSESERDLLRRWIDQGAQYESHWAFAAPVQSPLPEVQDRTWPANEIDYFVLAKLESRGLRPAPPADPATLIRRVALDITGLPPEPELVENFVRDPSPAAYEAVIDQLMARPAWGEHRARYWLDLARYADTHGIHFDNFREIWAYRDWVIDAFNRNQPFDQFTIEQLAGDLLPQPTLDQQVATGFNRCNITTNEGGVIEEEYAVLYSWDRTETTAQTWMGLTVGCAACHDHKFDPLTQEEFYQLTAFFNNTTQPVMDGNVHNTPPTIFVPAKADRDRWEELQARLPKVRQQLEQRREAVSAGFDKWLSQPEATAQLVGDAAQSLQSGRQLRLPTGPRETRIPLGRGESGEADWLSLPAPPPADPQHPQALIADQFPGGSPQLPGVGDLTGDQPFSMAVWLKFHGDQNNGALLSKMPNGDDYRGWDLWSEGGRVGMHLIHHWSSNAIKVVTQSPLPSDQWQHLTVTYDGSQKAAGLRIFVNGQAVAVTVANDNLSESIRNDLPLILFQRHGAGPMTKLALDDFQIWNRVLEDGEVVDVAGQRQLERLQQALARRATSDDSAADSSQAGDEALDPELRKLALDRYLERLDPQHRQLRQQIAELEEEQSSLRRQGTYAHVMHERDEAATAHVRHRGQYDQRRQEVTADTPAMLPPMADDLPRNRLGLAQWLVSDDHPLTARVTVNQFWQSVFGHGLVASSGDFGMTGALPSHPELLDYLAVQFRQDDWDVQRFFKRIFLSQTYRQSAALTEEKLLVDPDNIWLSRGPRFRMDAEMLRDMALAASGILVPEIGGPSVRPYQPEGVWEAVAMIGSNTRDYRQDSGSGLYRRSMYTFWKRSAPPASMDVFNAPNRETCTVLRERTNTPLQALATLNDPQWIEAARFLATRVLRDSDSVPVSVAEAAHGADVEGADGVDKKLAEVVESGPGERPAAAENEAAVWSDERLDQITLRILCRRFDAVERDIARQSWESLLTYYQTAPEDAAQLIALGQAPVPNDLQPAALAAWTLLASQIMNLDEALNK